MQKRWKIKSADAAVIKALSDSLRINAAICKILVQRNVDTFEKAKSYFRPQLEELHSPWLMKDMHAAVSRIQSAINNNENILIATDSAISMIRLRMVLRIYAKISCKW